MSFDFSALAATAVNNNNNRSGGSSTPSYALPIEEARAAVIIVDGNKVAKEDGSQALTLKIGRITIALDVIKPNATRVNAEADQVEDYTAQLRAAVDAGALDEAIVAAQAKGNPANRVAVAKEALEEADREDAPEGVDLEALDGE